MPAQLNHTIIWCRDRHASSAFLAGMLGLPAPRQFHHFMVVDLANQVSLDFMETATKVAPQHYAFLITEPEFDAVLTRIRARHIRHWADPARTRPSMINRDHGGRGVYFEDPDGHVLEVITQPYGEG